jgi:hypothetical protein
MASVLETRQMHRPDVKRFVLTQAYRLKAHAPQMAARGGITERLVCFATVEPCRTFSCDGAKDRRASSRLDASA